MNCLSFIVSIMTITAITHIIAIIDSFFMMNSIIFIRIYNHFQKDSREIIS